MIDYSKEIQSGRRSNSIKNFLQKNYLSVLTVILFIVNSYLIDLIPQLSSISNLYKFLLILVISTGIPAFIMIISSQNTKSDFICIDKKANNNTVNIQIDIPHAWDITNLIKTFFISYIDIAKELYQDDKINSVCVYMEDVFIDKNKKFIDICLLLEINKADFIEIKWDKVGERYIALGPKLDKVKKKIFIHQSYLRAIELEQPKEESLSANQIIYRL